MRRWRGAVVAAATIALVVPATAASAGNGGEDVTTVAGGLDGPRQLAEYEDDRLLVAESDTGEISAVDPHTGAVEVLFGGLPTPQGLDYDDGHVVVALGEQEERAAAAPRGSTVLVTEPDGSVAEEYDLLAYELEANPDGQAQFQPDGAPYDALSNPFSVHVQDGRILVADAGANAVLAIDRESGEISTFFVPPLISPEEVPGCAEAQAQPDVVGCDPVPTGVTVRDGDVYVSTLGAEVEGAARVYVLDDDGEVERVVDGLTGAAGVEADRKGTIWVSELFAGLTMEPTEPPTEEQVAAIGRVVRIDRDGNRSYVPVTLPSGLELADGELYVSAWSVAGFVGFEARGEVVRIGQHGSDDDD